MGKGNLMNMVIKHAKKIVSIGGFQTDITIQVADEDAVTVTGTATSHHTSVNTDGEITVGMNAHVTIHEGTLNDAGLTTRDSNGEIDLSQWLIQWTDAIGVTKVYSVSAVIPDNTLGLIPIILGKHGS